MLKHKRRARILKEAGLTLRCYLFLMCLPQASQVVLGLLFLLEFFLKAVYMLRLARFIKPFLAAIALSFVLLFVQALCDLNLPNLMSNIVNVGIQQGGVEDRAPLALSSDGYDLMQAFMDEEQKQFVDESYELVLPTDTAPNGNPWNEHYPSASKEGFYVQNSEIDTDTLAKLDTVFGLATWTMITVAQEVQENGIEALGVDSAQFAALSTGNAEDALKGTTPEETAESTELSANLMENDLATLYEATPLLAMIPDATMDRYRAQAAQTDEMMLNESATMLASSFYQELGVNMDDYEMGYIIRIGLIMLLITLIGGAATVLVGLLSSRAGAGLARDLRSAIFKKVLSFSHTEFDRFSTASLITRSTNDVTQLQMVLTLGIRMICYAPIMGTGAVIMALQKSVSMSWIMGVAAIFLLLVMGVLMAIVMPKFKIIQKLIDRLNLVAREGLNGQMVVRAFSRADFEMNRFDQANLDVTRTNLFVQRAMVFMMPIMMIFMNGLSVLIVWVGAEQVAASQMQVGDIMAYMQYAMMMVMSFMYIAMAFVFVPRAAVSAGRIADVLETEPVITDPLDPVVLPDNLPPGKRGRIEFKEVSFGFENADAYALEHINFVAEPGSTTAIIGSTGSGKSSILNLIPRFYDPSKGAVLLDGVDIRKLSSYDLRSRIGYVPQKSLLMRGTIAENIAYGNPAMPAEDIEKAAEVAQAIDFINTLEQDTARDFDGTEPPLPEEGTVLNFKHQDAQLDTKLSPGFGFEIAQGGSNVSGGQRQRLAIARALAIRPEIFLFDDSFSALDFATDAALRKALAAYTQDATLIIVAQRVGTIMDAESIYVLDDGAVIGHGTHTELLRTCPAYREIAESQLSPEMIAASLGGDTK